MSWHESEEVQQAKDRLARKLQMQRSRGEVFERLEAPKGSRHLAATFWGKAWCRHLEAYSDYEHRLPRGRSYLRQGNVYNLAIEPGTVRALVTGSDLYEVEIRIALLETEDWGAIQAACAGKVGSLLDLLSGQLGQSLMEVICNPETGVFPKPGQIRMSCTCPDWADMCKHVAAVLYGVALKFDADAGLFFRLRGVDPADLLATGVNQVFADLPAADDALRGIDLGALFGIDLADGSGAPEGTETAGPRAPEERAGDERA